MIVKRYTKRDTIVTVICDSDLTEQVCHISISNGSIRYSNYDTELTKADESLDYSELIKERLRVLHSNIRYDILFQWKSHKGFIRMNDQRYSDFASWIFSWEQCIEHEKQYKNCDSLLRMYLDLCKIFDEYFDSQEKPLWVIFYHENGIKIETLIRANSFDEALIKARKIDKKFCGGYIKK